MITSPVRYFKKVAVEKKLKQFMNLEEQNNFTFSSFCLETKRSKKFKAAEKKLKIGKRG